jgi:hypothetical protein
MLHGVKYDALTRKLKNLIHKGKQQHKPERTLNFYNRVVDLTSTQFNEDELKLPNKGLQCNLSYTNTRQWLEKLVIKTEVAISKLPIHQHEGLRYLAKQSINKIVNKQYNKKSKNTIEFKALKSVKQKLIDNVVTIT